MTDTEFLHLLDKAFEKVQEADIKGYDLFESVYELLDLCKQYISYRVKRSKKEKYENPLNGAD